MLKVICSLPFHPMLLAMGYVLMSYNLHADIYAISQIWLPLGVIIAAAETILALCFWWKANCHEAAVWASGWIVILTFVSNRLDSVVSQIGSQALPSGLYLVAKLIALGMLSLGVYVLAKRIATLGARATRSANIFTIIFLIAQSSNLIRNHYFQPSLVPPSAASFFVEERGRSIDASPPNIFHIVMDDYSRDDVLKAVYNFDNSLFLIALQGLGFHLFQDAHAPFNQTLLSMPSVFSGAYLEQEKLQSQYRDALQLRRSLGQFFDVGAVIVSLRGLGYYFSAAPTGYNFIDLTKIEHQELPPNGETNLFALALYRLSLLGRVDNLLLNNRLGFLLFKYVRTDFYLNALVRYVLSLGVPSDLPTPYLVYRHILAPHPPFTLDRFGQDVRSDQFSTPNDGDGGDGAHGNFAKLREAYIEGYVEKLRFSNHALLGMLNRIITEAHGPFVIFLHSDHGGGAYFTHESMTNTCLKERFSVLMAVYASDPELQRYLVDNLKHAPNPVNFYRALYNAIHKTNHPMLSDQSQFATWSKPWAFSPVPPESLTRECAIK